MFKRRLAVLGTIAVVALAGLAGPAMADETPHPGKVICKASDGEIIKKALPGSKRDLLGKRKKEALAREPEHPGKALKGKRLSPAELKKLKSMEGKKLKKAKKAKKAEYGVCVHPRRFGDGMAEPQPAKAGHVKILGEKPE